ncbi:hypothetical protein B9Z55_025708 [Caenorhabditis nigoni]|uniref:Domain of unknown function WSN domain-containing protein n=1 Tax=Caenorhabditis nigoni TaxID=1611254 RepID=A0A2G5SZJ3_9PELO|nr:hypothetical protein B9Z55_025708 [Caenorhabditis nigoni]
MLLLPKSLLFLCIVSYSSSSIIPRQGEKLVDSVVEALTAVKLDDAHILTALNELGPKAAKLFKTLVPLGSLALQTFATKPRSDEYKILKGLKNQTQPVWDDNDSIIVVSAGALGLHELLKQYKEKVTDQIRKLNEYSNKYLDPEANREASFIKQFHDSCESGESEPIKDILLKEPLNPFPNEYENYQDAARHLFDELKVKDSIDSAIGENSNNVYETLIVQAGENNYESFFEGTGNQVEGRMYDQTFAAEKLNTTIQSEMSNLYNADDLQIAVGSLKEKLEKTFYQSEISRLNATSDLQMIADSLKTKIGKDILNEFSGWAIIRESNHTKCPDVKLWPSPYNSVALESITALSYTNKGSFTENCEEFRFFFFL